MKLTLIFETDDAAVMRAVSTAAAMIEESADATTDPSPFALGDAITTTAWLVEALGETLDDHRSIGFDLHSCVPDAFRERMARQLRSLAALLLAPPLPVERKDERLAEARQLLSDTLAAGVSPAAAERRFSFGMDEIGEGDDLFGFGAIPD